MRAAPRAPGHPQGAGRVSAQGRRELKRLRYRAPFDWEALLAFLRPRAIPGVERIEDGIYRRTVAGGELEVAPARTGDALALRANVAEEALVAPVRRLFDLDAEPAQVAARLAGGRDLVGRSVAARPGVRVPGAFDPFETSIRILLGQQVSVAAATTLAGRLVAAHGRPQPGGGALFPDAATLAGVEITGMPRARAAAIRAFAAAVASGELTLLPGAALAGRPGIGPWTAGTIAMRALGDRDAFPDGDLVLVRAAGVASAAELRRLAERWRPYRAYAAMHLWLSSA